MKRKDIKDIEFIRESMGLEILFEVGRDGIWVNITDCDHSYCFELSPDEAIQVRDWLTQALDTEEEA